MMALEIIQSIAICCTLIVTLFFSIRSAKLSKIENSLRINESHRDLWLAGLSSGKIERIYKDDVDLQNEPITDYEHRFVALLLLHASNSFRAMNSGACVKIEGLNKDLKHFLSKPIPRAVWNKVNIYHDKHFAEHVRKLLEDK